MATASNDLLRKPQGSAHFVRFYDDDALLLDEVTHFVDDALRSGGSGIVIATPEHMEELRRRQLVLCDARGTPDCLPGQLVMLDAAQTLSRFMVNGWPDERRFNASVGKVVASMCAEGGMVNAFGEMVAVLCAQGQYDAAIRLEQLWNTLAQQHRFSLFCAYSWRLFPTAELASAFQKVCAEHDHACSHHHPAAGVDPKHQELRLLELEQKALALEAEVARRIEAEQSLKEREKEFADFLENAAEGIHRVGADGTILWANKAELQMLGYRWEEYVGRHIAEFHLDHPAIEDILGRLASGETLYDYPARLRCKDGAIKHVLIHSNGCFENGELRYTRCFTRDATERQQRDEALSQRDRMLLQAPVAAALLMGEDFSFRLANRHYCKMTARSDLEGKTFAQAFPELEGGEVTQLLQRVYRTGQAFSTDELRLLVNRSDGLPEERFFKFSLEPLTVVDGQSQGIIMVAVDISEQVRCRQGISQSHVEREELLAELTKASRVKDEFLAMLGHELRNPLSPIVMALELMRQRGDATTAREQGIIRRQVEHLVRLVDDLLDVSRITRGQIKLKVEAVAISKVLVKAIDMTNPLLEQRGHQLSLDIEPELYLEADPARLAQITANLLSNAARYTETGGCILLSARRASADWLEIRVKDNGIGIPEEMLSNVFDLFVQGKRNIDRSEGGLGVGLSLVRNIVELHGGDVRATSAGLGMGSEFIVRLPIKSLFDMPEKRTPARVAEMEGIAKRRIMIVDDNVDAADTLGRLLIVHGHTVEVFNDPVAALAAVSRFQPEVAVLDIGLPTLDGYELASRIRAHLGDRPLHLVALTGYGQDADKARSKAAGFDLHLVKPISPDQVASLLRAT